MNTPIKWYNIADSESKHRAYNFIIGGRGIGKTYSTFSYCFTIYPGKILYLRNTEVQIEESCGRSFDTSFGNPFKKWSRKEGRQIYLQREKKHAVILEGDTILGFGGSLSTFENLRGVDLSDIDVIIFDEFIEDRALSYDQYKAFSAAYETVNRNRELEGEPPVKVFLLSNAQRLSNPILRGLGLISVIEGMQRNNQRSYTSDKVHVELPQSEVSELKKNTALYSVNKDSRYYKEAIENKFANDSFTGVNKKNLTEYIPLYSIDDIFVYRHKSNGRFYACGTFAENTKHFTTKDNYIVWLRVYGMKLRLAVASDLVDYADYTTKSDLLKILKMLY